ncbi:Dirigent protein 23 [Dionaea muscipula]
MAAPCWSEAESWGNTVDTGKQNTTTLRFYFHDTQSGKNPSAVRVAQAQGSSSKYLTSFGTLLMADDPLTVGPDPNSKLVGRAQGLYGSASKEELSLIMAMSYSFTDGIYDGSSISIFGWNPAAHPEREMPVVGGAGIFRMARGYALAHTYWVNLTTGDAIVGYNITVVH